MPHFYFLKKIMLFTFEKRIIVYIISIKKWCKTYIKNNNESEKFKSKIESLLQRKLRLARKEAGNRKFPFR